VRRDRDRHHEPASRHIPLRDQAKLRHVGAFNSDCETLSPATPTQGTCTFGYTPAATGVHTITATYPGDGAHDSSQDTDLLGVTQTTPGGPGTGTTAKRKCKKRKKKHSVSASKKKRCKKRKRR